MLLEVCCVRPSTVNRWLSNTSSNNHRNINLSSNHNRNRKPASVFNDPKEKINQKQLLLGGQLLMSVCVLPIISSYVN